MSTYALPELDFQFCLLLSFITAVLVPCFRRGSVERSGMLALQVYFTVQAYLAPVKPTGNLVMSYQSGLLLGNLTLRYLDRLYLHVPEDEFRRTHENGVEERPETLSMGQKLGWSAELLLITRGVGWNWRVKGTPKATSRRRTAFVLDRLLRWVAIYGGIFLAERVCEGILSEWAQLPEGLIKSGLLAVTQSSMFLYVWIVLVMGLTIYTHFAMLVLPLALLCVGCGIGPVRWRQPDAWPATFGSLAEAYSLRRFWSHCWHQQVRRILAVPPMFVLSSLPNSWRTSSRLPARLFRRYSSLLLAFLLSGAFHNVGHWTVLRERRGLGDNGAQISVAGEMPFFAAQAAGIMLEDLVYHVVDLVYHVLGMDSRRKTLLGYMVTAGWYGWTRVQFKMMPIAATFGISDERGPLFEVVELLRLGLVAIPGNFVKMGIGRWM
ncbi:uncharacterized protein CC84DRAFT_1191013 [Paraphaeosphaeria sporulosa]|uniref:Wax synthase domain-containing protein n=1 Tax=Paraphaeosphaeria sporulosa TaxID=1460663 RepID=A0A177BYV4_9PLEO|nr:uncharacterized protein CC84DRAFT_1191013 [Paraphaeosphaeria sporulosa]OAF99606.1 hypothetical protein CC84DRAFT_1191013 [Paraphaeosphaeria sporulosa]